MALGNEGRPSVLGDFDLREAQTPGIQDDSELKKLMYDYAQTMPGGNTMKGEIKLSRLLNSSALLNRTDNLTAG